MQRRRSIVRTLLLLLSLIAIAGCGPSTEPERQVVLYTSVDEPVVRGLLAEFEQTNHINVIIVSDTEATKSVGLTERIRAERDAPHGDVFWANEVFNTILLADEGLLATYESQQTVDIPKHFRDSQSRWAGTAIRARVIAQAVNTNGQKIEIVNLEDLCKPELKDKIAIARPTAGTTGGHVAALYTMWGEDVAKKYFHRLRENGVKLLGGNSIVAQEVARGTMFAGLTDNDDIDSVRAEGMKVVQVLPDQANGGTLAIPTSVALINGAKHPEAARKLIDYLLSPRVEKKLIERKFAGWSVRVGTDDVHWMPVDYHEVARQMPTAIRSATAILEGRE